MRSIDRPHNRLAIGNLTGADKAGLVLGSRPVFTYHWLE